MQHAIVLLQEKLDSKGWTHGVEYGFVGQMHDEYTAEVREDLAEEYKEVAEDCIALAATKLNLRCPHKGEGEIGDNWWQIH